MTQPEHKTHSFLCSFHSGVSCREHTSAMMWMCIAVFLLWMKSGRCTDKANTSDLIEYTAADFYEKLHSGKMMFIYFEHQGRLRQCSYYLH